MTEQALQDAILRNSLQVLRYAAGQQERVDEILVELARELKDLVATGKLSVDQARDVNALIKQAEAAITLGYKRADAAVDTYELAQAIAEKTQEIIQDVIPAPVQLPTDAVLLKLGKDVLIDGAPSSAWWAKQGTDLAFRFAAQVRQGIANSETQEQIVARIVGRRGEPGIMDTARRNARALVHSSVMSAANRARLETYRKNGKLIKGVRWLATLDGHVCFTGETLVLMADGSQRPISEVRENDMVIGGVTGAACRVEYAGKHIAPSTVAIYKDGHVIGHATDDHPILTPQGWRDIGSVALSADLSKREVLCRDSKAPECAVSATRQCSGEWLDVCPEQCVAQVWRARDADHWEGGSLRHSLCDGDCANRATRDACPKWLQHDKRRRRVHPCAGGCGCDGAQAVSAVLGGRGLSCQDAGSADARCCERGDDPQGLVSDAGGAGVYRSQNQQPGMACQDRSQEPGARQTPGGAKSGQRIDQGKVVGPGLSGAGECCAGSKAGQVAQRSRLEGAQSCESSGNHAPEMARPRVSGQDGGSETSRPYTGSKSAGCSGAIGAYDPGATFGDAPESLGNPKSVKTAIITGELVNEPAEVYTLTIEGDPTFVAGGLIVHNCKRCAALDGQAWNLDGEKLPGTKVEFIAPPIHFGDRCVLSPIAKTFRDIGLDIPEPKQGGQRASSLGPVHGKTTFDDFLARQSPEFVQRVLGKKRADMWKAGKITVRDLVSGVGRELTIDELRTH